MSKFSNIIIGVMLFAAAAFGQAVPGSGRWQLTELNGEKPKNPRIYIEFNDADRRIAGHGGCNRVFGSYELTEGKFVVNGIGSTKMACMRPGTMETEREFLEALEKVDSMETGGGKLALSAGDRVVLRFSLQLQSKPQTGELGSRKWMLRSIERNSVDLTKDAPFLRFDAEKRSAGGNSGCNSFGGGYEAAGSEIRFTNIISTMRACEFEDRMTIERGFLDGLRSAGRYEIKGNRLLIYNGETLLLEFEGTSK